jgi:hypothetical protein
MTASTRVGPLLQIFFTDHLVAQRRLSLQTVASYRDYTGAADKAENLVGCKSPHHQLPGRVVSISDACGGNEACSART